MTYDTVDCQMPLLESRDANHYVKPVECGTQQEVYICEFTLPFGQTYQIDMMDENGDFTESLEGANSLTIFKKPTLLKVRVPALPMRASTTVETLGEDFPDGYTYECIFSKKFGHRVFRTEAVWKDSQSVDCPLPTYSDYKSK